MSGNGGRLAGSRRDRAQHATSQTYGSGRAHSGAEKYEEWPRERRGPPSRPIFEVVARWLGSHRRIAYQAAKSSSGNRATLISKASSEFAFPTGGGAAYTCAP